MIDRHEKLYRDDNKNELIFEVIVEEGNSILVCDCEAIGREMVVFFSIQIGDDY
jgi:hypothetical protein